MFHPQYWGYKIPTTLFEQTQYETEQEFYATFPAARVADLEQNQYDPTSLTDCWTSYDGIQLLDYGIHEEQMLISSTSSPFSGPTQLSCLPFHFNYQHSQLLSPSHYQIQASHYCLPPPVEIDTPVYIPSHQHSPESSSIAQSSSGLVPRESTASLEAHPHSNTRDSPNLNTSLQETTSDGESPRHDFCQLNRHMKPSTLKFTNNCQLTVMRLDRLSDQSHLDSPKDDSQSYASSSKTFSPKSPSIGLSSLPSKNLPERKPPLACLFCRGRKIACGPPLPGSTKKTCNQCRKRSLPCHYPSESRRGMRKKKPPSTGTDVAAETKPE